MRAVGERPDGLRLRALIVLLWRAGLRIGEALALAETDLDRSRGAVLVRRGKGGKRREVGMDRWAWQQLDPWLQLRHAHAIEMAHEGIPLVVIQRQLGHANLGITSVYLQGIDSSEIIETVHSRPAPTISATAGLARQ
jgi:site-specific recombinase XerD